MTLKTSDSITRSNFNITCTELNLGNIDSFVVFNMQRSRYKSFRATLHQQIQDSKKEAESLISSSDKAIIDKVECCKANIKIINEGISLYRRKQKINKSKPKLLEPPDFLLWKTQIKVVFPGDIYSRIALFLDRSSLLNYSYVCVGIHSAIKQEPLLHHLALVAQLENKLKQKKTLKQKLIKTKPINIQKIIENRIKKAKDNRLDSEINYIFFINYIEFLKKSIVDINPEYQKHLFSRIASEILDVAANPKYEKIVAIFVHLNLLGLQSKTQNDLKVKDLVKMANKEMIEINDTVLAIMLDKTGNAQEKIDTFRVISQKTFAEVKNNALVTGGF